MMTSTVSTKPVLTLALTKLIASAAEVMKHEWSASIAIVDESGRPL